MSPPPPPPPPRAEEEFIFRSKLPDISIPTHLPLHSYCFQNLSKFHNRSCLINADTGETLTYADVHLTVRKIAAGLNSLNIHQGDVIMLLLHNCPQFALSFLGASHRGAVITTANPFYTTTELSKQATATKSKLIITQSTYVEKINDFAKTNDIKVICIDSSSHEDVLDFSILTQANEKDAPEVNINPNDVVAIPFSSGTSIHTSILPVRMFFSVCRQCFMSMRSMQFCCVGFVLVQLWLLCKSLR